MKMLATGIGVMIILLACGEPIADLEPTPGTKTTGAAKLSTSTKQVPTPRSKATVKPQENLVLKSIPTSGASLKTVPKSSKSPTIASRTPVRNKSMDPELKCTPELSLEKQKHVLIALADRQLEGFTKHDSLKPRIYFPAQARDRRQGGIWVVVEYNIDDYDNVPKNKSAAETEIRDIFHLLYAAGCSDLQEVHVTARGKELATMRSGPQHSDHVLLLKMRLKREKADTVDWKNKNSIDFKDVWDVLLFNTGWRRKLRELESEK